MLHNMRSLPVVDEIAIDGRRVPVVGSFVSGGRCIPVVCAGNFAQITLDAKLLTRRSLQSIPVNSVTKQVSAITEGGVL